MACVPVAQHKFNEVKRLFVEADVDGSGCLDREEMAAVIQRYYKTEGTARSAKRIQEEVDQALATYSTPEQPGQLLLAGFAAMLFGDPMSQVRCTELMKREVSQLARKDAKGSSQFEARVVASCEPKSPRPASAVSEPADKEKTATKRGAATLLAKAKAVGVIAAGMARVSQTPAQLSFNQDELDALGDDFNALTAHLASPAEPPLSPLSPKQVATLRARAPPMHPLEEIDLRSLALELSSQTGTRVKVTEVVNSPKDTSVPGGTLRTFVHVKVDHLEKLDIAVGQQLAGMTIEGIQTRPSMRNKSYSTIRAIVKGHVPGKYLGSSVSPEAPKLQDQADAAVGRALR